MSEGFASSVVFVKAAVRSIAIFSRLEFSFVGNVNFETLSVKTAISLSCGLFSE